MDTRGMATVVLMMLGAASSCSVIDALTGDGDGSGSGTSCDGVDALFLGSEFDRVVDTCSMNALDQSCQDGLSRQYVFSFEPDSPGLYTICVELGQGQPAPFSVTDDCSDSEKLVSCSEASCVTRELGGGIHHIYVSDTLCRPDVHLRMFRDSGQCPADPNICAMCSIIDASCFGGVAQCEQKFSCLRADTSRCGFEFSQVLDCFQRESNPCFPPQGPCGTEVSNYLSCVGNFDLPTECGICPDACGP